MTIEARRHTFRTLHDSSTFVMPNPHDIGSARLLDALGYAAIATTSAGFAASLGRLDMNVRRDELIEHVRMITDATDLPVNVDSEQCFPDDDGGVARTVELLADAGAAGCSLEDWNPSNGAIESLDVATARVKEAAQVAHASGIVLTARAENHLRGIDDLDDTIKRLSAYRDAGADCVYAPGLVDLGAIARVVRDTATPVNVLLLPDGPTVTQLAEVGVRRISVGSSLSRIAFGAFAAAAQRLLDHGMLGSDEPFLDRSLAARAFAPR